MHKMGSSDSSKGKSFLKKRAHRPWNMVFLEAPLEAESPSKANAVQAITAIETTENKNNTNLEEILEEKTKECHEIQAKLNSEAESRLLIGGFLHPRNIFIQQEAGEKSNIISHLMNELKTKEQEILSLSNDLKISKALDQVEKLEFSRRKEEEARKSAENKALFAIQEAKAAAEQAYKIECALNAERQYRVRDEKIKKALGEKNQFILQEIAEKEKMLLKTKEALEEAVTVGQKIKVEAEEKIRKIVKGMSDQIAKYKSLLEVSTKEASEKSAAAQLELQRKIREIEIKTNEKIKRVEAEAERKIQEAQKQIQYHEKAKTSVQSWGQKNLEALRQTEIAKKEIEAKLETFKKSAADERNKFEAKIHDLLEQLQQNEEQKMLLEKDKSTIEKNLFQSTNAIKTMKTIIENEKNLRKILEAKLKENPVRIDEQKRKFTENKILELTKYIGNLEIEKFKIEENLANMTESVNKLQILMESEKTLRASLETQLKEAIEKICQLETLKQKEIDAKQLAEQKVSILISQKEHLEQEKLQNEEKLKTLIERIQELEVMLESEKYLRKEAERLKALEEQARKAVQDKITHAIEQANSTVLNALSNLSTLETPNEHA